VSESSQASSPSSFFNLHVEGVGYLNRVRTVKPKKGQEFLACTVAALRGSDSDVSYTKFDCRVSGADAQAIVKRLERRFSAAGAERVSVDLTLTADGGAELLDRVRIAVAFRSDPGSACRIDHSRAPSIAARRAESLAGCVSPVDARYASPETGQIS